MNQSGIHVPNGTIPAEDKQGYLDLGGSHFTFLHEQTADALTMRRRSPSGTLLCRFYLPRWPDRGPRDWARECARWYTMEVRDPGTGEPFSLQSIGAAVTPANEQNLGEEGGGDSAEWYSRINAWNLEWFDEFTKLTGIDRSLTHWPATAAGHSDDQNDRGFIGYEICRPSIEAYGVLDVHTYWDAGSVLDLYEAVRGFKRRDRELELYGTRIGGGWRFVLAHERFPDKPIFISECGQFDVLRLDAPAEFVAWFDSLRHFPYVVGSTPFIFRDPTGAHSNNNWGRHLAIEQTVRRAIAAGTIPNTTGGIPVTLAEIERWASDVFKRAGVAHNKDSAIAKYWLESARAGHYLGRPEGPEFRSENGQHVLQEFGSAILTCKVGEWIVREGLPFA